MIYLKNVSNKKRKKIYIYNPKQARFYIKKGAELIGLGVNKQTLNAYCVFYKDDHLKYFDEWCTRDKNISI